MALQVVRLPFNINSEITSPCEAEGKRMGEATKRSSNHGIKPGERYTGGRL